MVDLLENKLMEGIREGILNGNRLASVLFNIVSTGRFFKASRRELAADLISSPMPEKFIDDNNKTTTGENAHFSDLRFLGVSLAGIKKYPVRDDSLKYGLSFSRDGMPVNSIFVGANGIGKTSIYSALEYAGMGKINSALVRRYERKIDQAVDKYKNPEEDQSAFFMHSGTERKDVSLCLFTLDKEIKLEGEALFNQSGKPEVTEAFYCSDYDVRELETNDDYTRFMLKQIGLNHFYHALQLLYYLRVYVKTEHNKSLENIWGESPARVSEPIQRLKLGIAIGHLKKIKFKDLDWQLLKNVIENNQNFNLVKNSSESIISSLNDEQTKFPREDWFSIGVYSQYDTLLNLLRDFQNSDYSFDDLKKNDLMQSIDSFISFRNLLVSEINVLQNKLDKNKKPGIRLHLIEGIAQKHNFLIGNNKDEQTEGLFESEEKANLFAKEYNALVDYLEGYLEETLTKWKDKIKTSIETLLEDYFAIDNDLLVVDLKINNSKDFLDLIDGVTDEMENEDICPFVSFNISVMTARGELTSDKRFPIKPRQYLNTFRFKLFCVAVKIVLGCFVKETYAINYPFVIDDVFDSSDFDSRLRLKQFVEKIVECHDGLLSENKYAIQFIFFTQDDLIADQINKGLIVSKGASNVKFGRIYDYHETEDLDTKSVAKGYVDSNPKIYELQSHNRKDNNNKYISLEGNIK